MRATYMLTSDDLRNIIARHVTKISEPLGDVDIDIRLYEDDDYENQVTVPSLIADIVPTPNAGSTTYLIPEEADEAFDNAIARGTGGKPVVRMDHGEGNDEPSYIDPDVARRSQEEAAEQEDEDQVAGAREDDAEEDEDVGPLEAAPVV